MTWCGRKLPFSMPDILYSLAEVVNLTKKKHTATFCTCLVNVQRFPGPPPLKYQRIRYPPPISERLLYRNVQRFRGGIVFKVCRRLYHSTLGLRVRKKKTRRFRVSAVQRIWESKRGKTAVVCQVVGENRYFAIR